MTPERYRRAQQVFEQVCDLDRDERGVVIERACGGDATLRREVVELLAHDDGDPDTDARSDPRFALGAPRVATQALTSMPDRIGRYRIIRFVGAGGMGMVFQAEQDEPQRTVALKLLNPGLATAEVVKRFRREVHVLGLLHHPGIAQVYDAGTADSGEGVRAFFVMEFVEGEPILEWIRRRKIGVRERLELVARLSDAVQHAHTKGVVHRDLKPGNILVTGEGQPKILDFGVARITHPELRATTLRTEIGQLIGTIPYMSPEQTSGDPDEIDTRCDVYALGVLLYESLVDRPPYDLADRALAEALRIIREEAPRPLSTIDRSLRGDVETIVATALAKDKTRRYQTASSLADDIRRHLRDAPISARPPSALYQISKLVRRHRVPCALACALLLMSIAFGVIGTVQAHNLREANARAEEEAEEKAHQLYCSQIAQANMLYNDQNLEQLDALLDACDPDRRGWEWRWLKGKARPAVLDYVSPHSALLGAAVVGDDIVALDLQDNYIVGSQVRDGSVKFRIPSYDGVSRAFALAEDGTRLVTGHKSGVLRLWDLSEHRELWRVQAHDTSVATAVIQGSQIVTTTGFSPSAGEHNVRSTDVAVWDVATGANLVRATVTGLAVATAIAPSGTEVAVGGVNGQLRVFELEGRGERLVSDFRLPISAVCYLTDTKLVAGVNGRLAVVDTRSGVKDYVGAQGRASIAAIEVSRSGEYLAATDMVGMLTVLSLPSGDVALRVQAHGHPFSKPAFMRRKELVYTWSYDRHLRIWQIGGDPATTGCADCGPIGDLVDDKMAVVVSKSGRTTVFNDLRNGECSTAKWSTEAVITALVASQRELVVWMGTESGELLRSSLESTDSMVKLQSMVTAIGVSADGVTVAAACDADVSILQSSVVVSTMRGPSAVHCLAVSEREVFTGHSDGVVRRVTRGEPHWKHDFKAGDGEVSELVVERERHRVLAVVGGSVHVLDLRTGEELVQLSHDLPIRAVAISPDGTRLITAGQVAVHLWSATGEKLLRLSGWGDGIEQLRFSSDGQKILARYRDGHVAQWTLPSDAGLPWVGALRRAASPRKPRVEWRHLN